jgi:hypothetical protein
VGILRAKSCNSNKYSWTHGWSETGFFCDNISLQTAETAKNPVSLVLMRKSRERKS